MKMQSNRTRHGMASVMAMMYLALIAALAVGFYTAVSTSGSIANNETSIQRAGTTAEAGISFWRYQNNVISVPYFTTSANLIPEIYSAMSANCTNLNNYSASGWVFPTEEPAISPSGIAIPGQSSGWSWSPTIPWATGQTLPALPSNTSWVTTDTLGDEAFMYLAQQPGTFNLYLLSLAQNTNNVTASDNSSATTFVQRKLQLEFQQASLPQMAYGLVSYGEVYINSLAANPSSIVDGIWVIQPGSSSTPLDITSTGVDTITNGDVYYTSSDLYTSLSWGSAKVDTYSSSQGQNFAAHVHNNQPPPAPLAFDESGYTQYAGATSGSTTLSPGSIATAKSNVILSAPNSGTSNLYTVNASLTGATIQCNGTQTTSLTTTATGVTLTNILVSPSSVSGDAANYTFNIGANGWTIDGIMILPQGANVTFTGAGTLTINGAIVQASGATSGTVAFNCKVVQNTIAFVGGLIAGENTLTGTGILLPSDTVTFNNNVTANDTIVAGVPTINTGYVVSISKGSFVSMGAIHINGALTVTQPQPTSKLHAGINYGFAAVPTSYTEVYP
jgi:hypothetical protein